MRALIIFLTVAMIGITTQSRSQQIQREASAQWRDNQWKARWIVPAEGSKSDYGIFRFRKSFDLDSIPRSFVVNVSADPRYELFVNGSRVCRGPARGNLYNWYYETVDLAQWLREGKNVIAATVWNYGEWSPGAQISLYSAFIMQGESSVESIANSDSSWKTLKDNSFAPSLVYIMDVGPGDIIDAQRYPWGWNLPEYDDSQWKNVTTRDAGQPFGTGTQYLRGLVPRTIPLMEERAESPLTVRRSTGTNIKGVISDRNQVTIPANSSASLLLDQGYLTNAYPELTVSEGRGAKISVTYSEGMFVGNNDKGNRNTIEGKYIEGYVDQYLPDGEPMRVFAPLWFRCYRYVQIDVQTAAQPLTIHSFEGEFTGYPFREQGSFVCSDKSIDKIWDIGWRTARLCAGETYYDCPYYEQLQYTGDTRIQALISLYVSGDDRLMRKAISDLASSATPEGILLSRSPARFNQIIPPFSLYWINILHDYWMHRDDSKFVGDYIPVLKGIVSWFEKRVDPSTGMLGALPHWNFTDWPAQWPWSDTEPTGGVPPSAREGGSAIITLQLAYALEDAARLVEHFGDKELADRYRNLRSAISKATIEKCYDNDRKLIADDIARTSFSQHATIMGILSEAIPAQKQTECFEAMMSDPSLIQATVYYRFYMFRAMKKSGLADRYLSSLGIWHDMIANGLTTFAERPEPSRSDCHAWSASPNYDLLATVCGIEPASEGFSSVRIAPNLGNVEWVKGSVPHPKGMIRVEIHEKKGAISAHVQLPEGVSGVFEHKNVRQQLNPGDNTIEQK